MSLLTQVLHARLNIELKLGNRSTLKSIEFLFDFTLLLGNAFHLNPYLYYSYRSIYWNLFGHELNSHIERNHLLVGPETHRLVSVGLSKLASSHCQNQPIIDRPMEKVMRFNRGYYVPDQYMSIL
jgi:hypothetical protein